MPSIPIDVTFQNVRIECSRALDDGIAFTPSGGTDTTITTTNSEIVGLPDDALNGAEVTLVDSAGAATVRRVDDFGVVGATATLTVRSLGFSPTSSYSGEVHNLNGKGWRKAQYDDAIKDGIRIGAHQWFTDTESLSLAYQRGEGLQGTKGMHRREYPLPSGFHLLWELDYLTVPSKAKYGSGNLQAYRALGDATARTRLSQGFKIYDQSRIEWVVVFLRKVGTPTDNITSVIETNTSALPSGTAVANGTSGNLGGANVQTTERYHVLRHNPPMLLDADIQYHLTLRRSGAVSATDYYQLGEDDAGQYGDGSLSTYNGTVWAAVSVSDLIFALFPPGPWQRLARGLWDYVPAATDELRIHKLLGEATPLRLIGGAVIAEPALESTNVAVPADWLKTFVIAKLQAGRAGAAVADPRGAGSQSWFQQLAINPPPYRHLPEGAVMVET